MTPEERAALKKRLLAEQARENVPLPDSARWHMNHKPYSTEEEKGNEQKNSET